MNNVKHNQLSSNISSDNSFINHKKESASFVLNGIRQTFDGERFSYINEPGTEACSYLPDDYKIVGHISMNNNEMVVFSTDDVNSEIGLLKNCKYTTLINNTCLNFSTENVLSGEYRIINGCERKIYWVDGVNPDRKLNIDEYLALEDCNTFDCNDLNMNPDIVKPCIEICSVNDTGGKLESGSYSFQIELIDDNLNTVHRTDFSNPINIYFDNQTLDYNKINGSYNIDSYTEPVGGIIETSKSICLEFTNLDTSYSYLRLNVIQSSTGDGITRTAHSVGELITFTDTTEQYIYKGYNASEDVLKDPNELLVPSVIYNTSKYIEQSQGRLLRANVKESNKDYSTYQRFASKICSAWVSRPKPMRNVANGNPKSPDIYWGNGFMGDEVEALGIIYLHKDGSESPVFHIPGRGKDQDVFKCNEFSVGVSQDQRCLNVKGTSEYIPDPDPFGVGIKLNPITYTIVYTVNGEEFTTEGVFDEIFEVTHNIFCGTESDAIVVTSFTTSTIQTTGSAYYEIVDNPGVFLTTLDDSATVLSTDVNNIYDEDVEKWKVYNTAYKYTEAQGGFGYYECESATYERPDDCCVENYWGVDCCGELIAGSNIRHHKFPDRGLIPQCKGGTAAQLGVKFANIEYPNDDIVGHYFVSAERNEFNRTILDKGVLGKLREGISKQGGDSDDYGVGFTYFNNGGGSTKYNWIYSPKILADEYLNGDYIKVENVQRQIKVGVHEKEFNDGLFAGDDFYIGARSLNYCNVVETTNQFNYKITENIKFNPLSKQRVDDLEVINLSQTNRMNMFKTENEVDLGNNSNNLAYVSIKVNKEVFSNLDGIRYKKINTCAVNLTETQEFYEGNTVMSDLNVANSVLVKIGDNIWDNVVKVGAIIGALAITVLTAGIAAVGVTAGLAAILTAGLSTSVVLGAAIAAAVGVTAQSAAAVAEKIKDGQYSNWLKDSDFEASGEFGTKYVYYGNELLNNFMVESDYNYSLRVNGLDCYSIYDGKLAYDGYFGADEKPDMIDYFFNVVAYYNTEDEQYQPKPVLCPEIYNFNKDFDIKRSPNTYYPITKQYDFCKKCLNEYTNRIVYSEKAFETNRLDNYLVHLANNFVDVSSKSGEITGLKYVNNNLLVHCEDTSFIIRPNPQQIQTDQTVAYIGTGDFLSLPAQELLQTDLGYAGSQHFHSQINTEYGYFWVDAKRGQVFNYNTKLNELSRKDNTQWFKENLPFNLKTALDDLGVGNIDTTFDNYGIGLMSVYDPRFKRYILHKKDFKPLMDIVLLADYKPSPRSQLIYDGSQFFTEINQTLSYVELTDSKFFENKSWTFSYDLDTQGWASYHSYMPDYMMFDNNHYYSTENSNAVNKHLHNNNFQTYYGNKYDYIVEWITNDYQTEDLHSVYYVAYCQEWDSVNEQFITAAKTYDRLKVYNSCLSTGLLNLEYVDQNENPYWNTLNQLVDTRSVICSDKNCKVSNLYNMSIGEPINTKSWLNTDYSSSFNNNGRHGYIDKVSNSDVINFDKNQYDFDNVKDKWVATRLFFNPKEDLRMTSYLHSVNEFNSKR